MRNITQTLTELRKDMGTYDVAAVIQRHGTAWCRSTAQAPWCGRAGRWHVLVVFQSTVEHFTFDTLAEAKDKYQEEAYYAAEAANWRPSCNICDGLGHGYPGAGPCPLENMGAPNSPEEDMMEALDPQVNGMMSAGFWG
jgi:hypothetical protein